MFLHFGCLPPNRWRCVIFPQCLYFKNEDRKFLQTTYSVTLWRKLDSGSSLILMIQQEALLSYVCEKILTRFHSQLVKFYWRDLQYYEHHYSPYTFKSNVGRIVRFGHQHLPVIPTMDISPVIFAMTIISVFKFLLCRNAPNLIFQFINENSIGRTNFTF